jgi:hypothetical protein
LVDADDLVDVLQPLDAVARAHPARRAVQGGARGAEERIHDEAALPGAADARDRRDHAERNVDRDVLEVVRARPNDAETFFPWLVALRRDR